jgi:predicted transcriptional regulator
MSENVSNPSRAELLKSLRAEHQQSVESTRELLKEQQLIRRAISAAVEEQALTIPAAAEATDLSSELVLWHVMAMKKYGLIEEMGMNGDYYTYQLVKES